MATILFLIVGLVFIFLNPLKESMVQQMSNNNNILRVSASTVEKNQKDTGNFDFDQVVDLNSSNIVQAFLNQQEIGQVGGIVIPKVQMNLPIVKGVSNQNLAVGAGTMKADQEMGVGNYALAGHNMNDRKTLFSPLYNVAIGDVIYLTDLNYIYSYRIKAIETVDIESVNVIQDVEDKKLITLVTCNADGSKRLIVQGIFEKKESIQDVSELESLFDI
ncbi:MAG: class A sortase [Carnobacterium sp.]|nr:class A sortase [Carnobacterium sp.]MCC4313345.1 sortase [Carnobacterium maltaromaticum]